MIYEKGCMYVYAVSQPPHGPKGLRVPLKPDSLNLVLGFTERWNGCIATIKVI